MCKVDARFWKTDDRDSVVLEKFSGSVLFLRVR